ncbi:HIRAN domain-containing protein [Asticcacaulis sp.]|uniref:HIRAN domain-containing protein n=1 Tax=Asticcacaulis sp. TaxID=1872648 RepID=UPI0026263A7C|nr:HIRAN domain-containing protein [Asticcacaulis sp.]
MLPQVSAPIKRRGLLAGLAGIVGGLATARTTSTRAAVAPSAPILLLESHVAGTAYYDADRLLNSLTLGQTLILRRQPGNRHDDLAIEVIVPVSGKLGYIPRVHNQPLARLMDAGKTLRAEVLHLSPGKWEKVWLQVWMAG